MNLLKALATSGLTALSHYYGEFENYHYGAVLLYPKTKHMTNFTDEERKRARDFISKALPSNQLSPAEPTSTIPEFIQEMCDQPVETVKHDEFKRYMEEYVDLSSPESIEQYWLRKKLDFPSLFEVAARILAIVPSESCCETAFSIAGFLLDKRRSRLEYSSVEKVIVGCQLASKYPEWVDP